MKKVKETMMVNDINENLDINLHENRHLGISFIYDDEYLGENIRLFFSLSQLKYILSTYQYDKLYFTNNWLRGFIHFRGENFSVVDPKALFNENKYTLNDVDTNLILFKEYENMRIGLLGRNISLIDLDEQYFGIKVILTEPEGQLVIDDKLSDIFKKMNMDSLMYISTEIVSKESQPNYLNLAHVQKYKKTYNKFFNELEKIRLHKDYNRKPENFNILYFASSFFVDESGILGLEIDIDKFNKYLYNTN